jgi:hypothetical protein
MLTVLAVKKWNRGGVYPKYTLRPEKVLQGVEELMVMQLIVLVVGGLPVVTATRRLFAWSERVGRITPAHT